MTRSTTRQQWHEKLSETVNWTQQVQSKHEMRIQNKDTKCNDLSMCCFELFFCTRALDLCDFTLNLFEYARK